MSTRRQHALPPDNFPFPYTTDNAEASMNDLGDGRMEITFKVDRNAIAPVLERWTWNQCEVTIKSGDRDIVVTFPKIEEKVTRRV